MNRADHLSRAEALLRLVAQLAQDADQQAAAAEMVWGATVHALSAADPSHETESPNNWETVQGLPHNSPNSKRTFEQAADRADSVYLSKSILSACRVNNQEVLHTHFYHGNLSNSDLTVSMGVGTAYVQMIIAIAKGSGI